MTHIDRELQGKFLNACSLTAPLRQSLDGKIVTQTVQRGSSPPRRWIHPQASRRTYEPLKHAAVIDVAAEFGNEECIGTLVVSQSSSEYGVLFESSRGRWMEWNTRELPNWLSLI